MLSCALLITAVGCAETERIHITSSPSGADVHVDGRPIGKTPCHYDFYHAGSRQIIVRMVGYKQAAREIVDAPFVVESTGPQHFILESLSEKETGSPSRTPAPKELRVTCDVRVVRLSDGSVEAHASGGAYSGKLEQLAAALARKLRDGVLIKGESVAVVSLRNRSGTTMGRTLADELADKLSGSLAQTGWFNVKERIDLRSVLAEKDLESVHGIVGNRSVTQRLAGVAYIVIGGVTVGASN